MVDVEKTNDYATKGVAGTGLGLGIAGTALGLLNGGLGNALGGGWGANGAVAAAADAVIPSMLGAAAANLASRNTCTCNEDHTVNRYEAAQAARIAELETKVKLRDANTYTDSKMLEMYQYVDGRLRNVESQLCQQAVVNAQVTANISCIQQNLSVLNGMTKTVIPINNVCPEPMARYNSWTAPTAAGAAAEAAA